ncbi:hypothetical protein EMPS_05841 [Entomortierella parvispora]|uniref:Tail specific protease domain-containing protein n=1 Tax=Entomortierella parvispora TaxID=205924 RepID=A0A9P3HBM4_9FUNG|nr:hypothetical protein EMPS_05841 [Entomortierella parvispora]
MKIASILTLAAALCAVSVNAAAAAAPHSTTTTKHVAKATSTTTKHAKATTTTTKNHKTTAKAKTTANAKTTTKAKTSTKPATKPATKPTNAPKAKDPCATLAQEGKKEGLSLSYAAVKGCYEAQPFNADLAAKTLAAIENSLGNFYAFVDQAKSGPTTVSGSPLQTAKVDIMGQLAKIKATKWKNDYEFQMALTYLTLSANDGHLAYTNNCYRTATFSQPLSLYAPVVNGTQDVRVFFVDTTVTKSGLPKDPSSLLDCKVVTIDGQPALKAIQDFTDRTSAISKDPGVRLNDALASTSWYSDWSTSPGGFAKRWEVPAKSSMDYTLQCGTKTQKLTIPWAVEPSDNFEANTFKDRATYWNVQCVASPSPYDSNIHTRALPDTEPAPEKRVIVAPAVRLFRERGTIALPKGGPRNGDGKAPSIITQATHLFTASTTIFYQLKGSSKNTCVAVIATEEAANFQYDASDYTDFIKGMQLMQSKGCTKLILDMTNNGGGSVDFAYFVNQLLFPTAKPYFAQDLRDNSLVQGAAKMAIKSTRGLSIFDARGYVSDATNKAYKDGSMFTKGVNYSRGGATVTFSQRTYFEHSWPFLPLKKNALKWKPKDISIITNGFCGSACTMIATRFAVVHGIKTYSIGGIAKRPLSYFSFPGGFVMDNAAIVSDLRSIQFKGGKTAPVSLPIMGYLNLAVGEIYAKDNSTLPIEYDSQWFAANVHLDQDPVSARHPDQVWVKIAKDFSK